MAAAVVALLVMLTAMSFGETRTASAHYYGWGSVNSYSDLKVHYTDYYTKYKSALRGGRSEWNIVAEYYNYYGPYFSYDYYENHLDLYAEDFSEQSGIYGYWTSSAGADEIYFNDYRVFRLSFTDQKKVATHELGHALGFGNLGDSWYDYSVMIGYPPPLPKYDQPFRHDYYDYDYSWY